MPDILVDVRCLQDPSFAARGIGRHALTLLRGAPAGVRLIGLYDPAMPELDEAVAGLLAGVRASAYGAAQGMAAFVELSPMTHDPLFVARVLQTPGLRRAAVVYDFIPLDAPERYLADAGARLDYTVQLRWLAEYDVLLPISESTAARTRLVLGERSMLVTGAPLDPAFAGDGGAARHVLVVGGEPRKDPGCAVRGHAQAVGLQHRGVPIVVLGHADPHWAAEQRAMVAALGGRRELLDMRGHVSHAELVQLYRDALCVVAPSHDEGFSLPVVEAMAAGVPVLASRIPAHAELLGEAALFDVGDDVTLAALLDGVEAPGWREAQAAANAAVWPRFTAEAVAARFWAGLAPGPAVPAVLRGARPRIAVLSPLPPARSGVADYTAAMLTALGERAEVHAFTDTAGAMVPSGAVSLAPVSAMAFLDGRFDRVLAVLGNSDHHLSILRGMLRFGAAAILHDGRLVDVYHGQMGVERMRRLAEVELGRAVGDGEIGLWLSGVWPPKALLLAEVARVAAPLMVHSGATVREIGRRYGVTARRLPFGVYRPWTADALGRDARAAARQRLGIADGMVLVVSFGFSHPSKAPEEMVWTIELLRAWGVPARLHCVGSAKMDLTPVRMLAARIGVEEHIDFGGAYAGEAAYRDNLLAADVALQLRSLGPGSVSGALADCIAAGLPTVASASLVEAVEAPDYVRAVPDMPSPVLVAEAALELVGTRAGTEAARQAYAAAHGFGVYAERLLEALEVVA